jgi:hypothetical protein
VNIIIHDLLTQDSGDSDVWGWGMGHMFAVAATLYLRDEDIPYEWHYRPAPGMTEEDERADSLTSSDLLDEYDAGTIDGEALCHAGNVLDRYLRCVKHAGKDY